MSNNICIIPGCKRIRTVTVESKWCHVHLQEHYTQTTPDPELAEILEEYGYAIVNHPEASRASHIRTYESALTAWAKNKALRAVGEDESEIVHERLSDERAEIRNDIKDEIRSNIHREFREG